VKEWIKVFESRVLRRIFGSERKEVSDDMGSYTW
jgi:hypothetical protein